MAKCYICDKELTQVEFNRSLTRGKIEIEPCPACLDIIYKTANIQNNDDVEHLVEEDNEVSEPYSEGPRIEEIWSAGGAE